jgi:cytochrome b
LSPHPEHRISLRVWDLPTRLTHGALILAVFGALISAKIGADWMVWHVRLGYGVATLLLFRLIWGFVGGRWSRFDAFVVGPAQWWRYLRQGLPNTVGHNPLGALSIVALLGLLMALVATGFVADDEVAYAGPLVHKVTAVVSAQATYWHSHAGQSLLLAWLGLHLVAVAYHQRIKHENLIGPMWHGDKEWMAGASVAVQPSRDDGLHRMKALGWFSVCGLGVAWLVSFGQAGS